MALIQSFAFIIICVLYIIPPSVNMRMNAQQRLRKPANYHNP